MLEPSVAVKQSAIEFAHSGRTLNRKEGSGHSFWSYCPATRLKQSNSSVAIVGCLQACFVVVVFFLPSGGHWGRGQGWLFMLFIYFWFSLMACLHAHSQVPIFLQQSERRVRVSEYKFWKWSSHILGFLYGCVVKIGRSKHLCHQQILTCVTIFGFCACVCVFNIYLFILAVPGLSCGIWALVPWPGMEPRSIAQGVWSLSHWTTGKSAWLLLNHSV